TSRWLAPVVESAAWLDHVATRAPAGLSWRGDLLDETSVDPLHLADGTAGVIYLYLGLSRVTGAARYRDDAIKAAAQLLAELDARGPLPRATSFYYGLGGVAFVLHELSVETGDPRYDDAARALLAKVKGMAVRRRGKVRFHENHPELLFGDAGTILFLEWAARALGDPAAHEMSLEAAESLVQDAIVMKGNRLDWSMRRDKEILLPNFTHGAAGIGYVMASLDTPPLLTVARKAGNYLDSVAVVDDLGYRLPYGWPLDEWEGRFDLGYAHGPAGAARYFVRMWQVTGEDDYRQKAIACATAIVASGAPEEPHSGFGPEPFDPSYRFGLASALELLVEIHRMTGAPRLRETAEAIAAALLERSVVEDGRRHWPTTRPAYVERPGEPAAYTGFFQGTAGYAVALLRLVELDHDARYLAQLPDYPFGDDADEATRTPAPAG
ncbi:MAG: hypothetical protein KC636_28820, partial [Myxococcales bacterium]|nr:hypothetical protein [Myxococcales bacterium]